eukprot:snap_masked-scaffold_10-processed-gene-13.23-mRNA-1 protein AED:1.00 eAED:1.00 QI:0/-1/0/0/-1/1/1/0/87
MTQVVFEIEPTSTQHLQELQDSASRRKANVQVPSLNFGGLTQYKLSTTVKFTHELLSLMIYIQEAKQNVVERLEKANQNANHSRKGR